YTLLFPHAFTVTVPRAAAVQGAPSALAATQLAGTVQAPADPAPASGLARIARDMSDVPAAVEVERPSKPELTGDSLHNAPPRVVRVYLRHCFIPAVGKPDPLWVTPAVDSRWCTPRCSLYVAEEHDSVMADHCRNSAAGVQAADPTGGVGLNERNFAYYAG